MRAVDILSSFPLGLITTNRAPNETELASAREILPYFKDEISDISAQIVEAEAQLRKLQSARRTLQRKEARLKCVAAPIRRVPQDVICLIFDYCLREHCALEDDLGRFLPYDPDHRRYSSHFSSSLVAGRLPLRLSRVSRAFRRIVLDMPTLWRIPAFKICLPFESTDVTISRGRDQLSGMKEWLRRSASLPLSLEVILTGPRYIDDNDELQKIYDGMIDTVISCHTRWRDITFCFSDNPPDKVLSALDTLTLEDLPLIRTIRFHSNGYKREPPYLNFLPIFSCPSLKALISVMLDNLHIHKDLLYRSFSNLTLLNGCLGTCDLTTATTLRQCTSLIELRLCITGDDVEITIGPEFVIELPCLQELYVIDKTREGRIIKHMSAPKLHTFYYRGQSSRITALPDIFKRSHSLRKLGFSGNLSCALFLQILRYCPQLTHLDTLPNFTYSDPKLGVAYDKLFTRLVDADNSGDIVCPRLEVMNTGYDFIPIVNVNTLDSIITRKGTASSESLAPWRRLRANIACMQKNDEATMRKLLRKCNRNIFILTICPWYIEDVDVDTFT